MLISSLLVLPAQAAQFFWTNPTNDANGNFYSPTNVAGYIINANTDKWLIVGFTNYYSNAWISCMTTAKISMVDFNQLFGPDSDPIVTNLCRRPPKIQWMKVTP